MQDVVSLHPHNSQVTLKRYPLSRVCIALIPKLGPILFCSPHHQEMRYPLPYPHTQLDVKSRILLNFAVHYREFRIY